MSFSVQGIAFSKKFSSLSELEEEIDLGNIQKVGVGIFKNGASCDEMDERDVYITELFDGTLITLGARYDIEDITLHNDFEEGKAMKFFIDETSKIFSFEYFEEGDWQRQVFSSEGEVTKNWGPTLGAEIFQEEDDWTSIIFNLIGEITGVHFLNIQPYTDSIHYRLEPAKIIKMIPKK